MRRTDLPPRYRLVKDGRGWCSGFPYNQRRWCGAAGIDRVVVLSDHYDLDFGHKFGTAIKEYRLLQRSIFVIGRDGKISYVEYVPEIAQHPDYDGALAAVRAVS